MNQLEQLARQHFGVKLPVARETLKTLYRAAARRLHTDTSGSAATKDAFVAMQQAYETLVSCGNRVFTGSSEVAATQEVTPLADLGLGLGPTKNGTECAECLGRGYETRRKKIITWNKQPCNICVTMGSTWGCIKCMRGGHTHHDEVKDVHTICAPCQGRGEIEILNPVIQKGFLGTGAYLGQKARKRMEQR